MKEIITSCFLCGCNCGMIITLDENDRITRIRGDKENAHSKGFICVKGLNQGAHIDSPHRLTTPLKRVGDRHVEVSWDEALDGVGQGLRRIQNAYGSRSIALAMGGSGHPTVPVMLAFQLARSLGTRNLYSPVGLELTSKYLANQKLYGCSQMEGFPDYENAGYVILAGTNPLISYPAHGPALRELGKDPERTLVVVDPRFTETGRVADIYTPIQPSTDVYFFLSLLQVVTAERLYDFRVVRQHATGLEAVKRSVARFTPDVVEKVTGVKKEIITRTAREFANAETGLIQYDMGVIANKHSTLCSWAVQVLNFITGRMGAKGGYLFNPTLLNFNASEKRAFGGDTYTSRVRGYPEITGFMPVTILQDEILTPGEGQVRAFIVSGCNPLRAYTNSAKMERAFQELELLVSIDIFMTEVGRMADYVLPCCSFHEQENISFGFHGLYANRFVQLTQKIRDPLGQSRPEWMIYRDIGNRAGAYWMDTPAIHYGLEIADKVRELLGKPGGFDRQEGMFRLMARAGKTSYDELKAHPHGFILTKGKPAVFMEEIRTPDKKARLAVPEFLAAIDRLVLRKPPRDPEYPFILSTTCRTFANVNAMYRNEAWIAKRMPENGLIMHPDDAGDLGVKEKEKVLMATRTGRDEVPVFFSRDVLRGTVYLSHGWGLYSRDPGDDSGKLRGAQAALFLPDEEGDAFTGMPFYSGLPCKVERITGKKSIRSKKKAVKKTTRAKKAGK